MAAIEHRHWSATSDPRGLFLDLPDLSFWEPAVRNKNSRRPQCPAGALERKWEKLASQRLRLSSQCFIRKIPQG